MIQRIVAEQAEVFGEFPVFEPGHYTFLLDLVRVGRQRRDGTSEQHVDRRSLVCRFETPQTADGSRLSSIAHEFFHVWNVERIRPADFEPFDFTRANVSCCLWFAEGFTDYYGDCCSLARGSADEAPVSSVANVANRSGRLVRSPVQMSEHAPFADRAVSNDMTRFAAAATSRITSTARRSPWRWTCRCAAEPADVDRSTTSCGVSGRNTGGRLALGPDT